VIHHIPALCFQHDVVLCVLDEESHVIGALFGLKSVAVIGFKKDDNKHKDLVDELVALCSPLNIPWLRPIKENKINQPATPNKLLNLQYRNMQFTKTVTNNNK